MCINFMVCYYIMLTLDEIGIKYGMSVVQIPKKKKKHAGGDKSSQGWDYLEYYDQLFKDYRLKEIQLLEIGILEGRSIATWADYFINGKIVGIDITLAAYEQYKPKLFEEGAFQPNGNVELLVGNSTIPELSNLLEKFGQFDFIIDDGDHHGKSQIQTFENLFYKFLKPGGIFIIEDSHGEVINQYFLNHLTVVSNFAKGMKNREKIRERILQSENVFYRHIESVEFRGRLIIVRKRSF